MAHINTNSGNKETLNFGIMLVTRMEMLGITQLKLAKYLNISRDSLHRYIEGNMMPSLLVAWKLARCLGFSLDELLYSPNGEYNNLENESFKLMCSFAYTAKRNNLSDEEFIDRHKERKNVIKQFSTQLGLIRNSNDRLAFFRELLEDYIEHEYFALHSLPFCTLTRGSPALENLILEMQKGAQSLASIWASSMKIIFDI